MNSSLRMLFFLFIHLFFSCTKDKAAISNLSSANTCDSIPSAFLNDVFPVFEQNCISCHNPTNPQGGYILDSHSLIVQNIQIVLTTIQHRPGAVPMPYQTAQLNESLIRIISCWKDNGLLNN
jgi:hypothetical protein